MMSSIMKSSIMKSSIVESSIMKSSIVESSIMMSSIKPPSISIHSSKLWYTMSFSMSLPSVIIVTNTVFPTSGKFCTIFKFVFLLYCIRWREYCV